MLVDSNRNRLRPELVQQTAEKHSELTGWRKCKEKFEFMNLLYNCGYTIID